MQVKVDWQDNVHFVANNNSGHTVAMDGPPEQGGQDRGSSHGTNVDGLGRLHGL